jgi:trehalose 6-phosphate phosphatase
MRDVLCQLARNRRIKVCIVSGRRLEDVKERVGVSGIIYVGNHGFEVDGIKCDIPGLDKRRAKYLVGEVCRKLSERLNGVEGVLVEDKGLTASVHYRQVSEDQIDRIKGEVVDILSLYTDLKLTEGRKVLEIQPAVGWGKGKVVDFIFRKLCEAWPGERTLAVYAGDDKADEEVFEVLGDRGVTILVSDKKVDTRARFRVKSVLEIEHMLRSIGTRFPPRG